MCRYQQALKDYMAGNPAFVAPDKRLNEVLGWVDSEVLSLLRSLPPASAAARTQLGCG